MLQYLTKRFPLLFSPPLPNTGSLARDALASERTFLAWTRSGLGFIALGIALEKVEAFAAISPTLLHLSDSKTKLSAGILVGLGSVTVTHGTLRYFQSIRDLQQGNFRPNGVGIAAMAASSIAIGVIGAIMVLRNEGEVGEWDEMWSGTGRKAPKRLLEAESVLPNAAETK